MVSRMAYAISQFSFVIPMIFLLKFQCIEAFLRYIDRAMSRNPMNLEALAVMVVVTL